MLLHLHISLGDLCKDKRRTIRRSNTAAEQYSRSYNHSSRVITTWALLLPMPGISWSGHLLRTAMYSHCWCCGIQVYIPSAFKYSIYINICLILDCTMLSPFFKPECLTRHSRRPPTLMTWTRRTNHSGSVCCNCRVPFGTRTRTIREHNRFYCNARRRTKQRWMMKDVCSIRFVFVMNFIKPYYFLLQRTEGSRFSSSLLEISHL